MAKKIDKQIKNYTEDLKQVMQDNLSIIAGNIISQIMTNYKKLPDSKKINAIKDINPKGLQFYKKEMLNAMAIVSGEALNQARSEVPKAKNVKLFEKEERLLFGEFEKLPAKIRARLKMSNDLLIGTQLKDLEKAIYFDLQTSIRNQAGEAEVLGNMVEAGESYVTSGSVNAGAGVTSANVVNEARTAFFFSKDVLEEIDAFQFVNGDPVSAVCQELAGTIFRKNDPNAFRYTPPLHYNCKSWIRPILAGNLNKVTGRNGKKGGIEKLEPTTKKARASVQFHDCQDACCQETQNSCQIKL